MKSNTAALLISLIGGLARVTAVPQGANISSVQRNKDLKTGTSVYTAPVARLPKSPFPFHPRRKGRTSLPPRDTLWEEIWKRDDTNPPDPHAGAAEPDLRWYDRFKGMNTQVFIRNWPKDQVNPTDVRTIQLMTIKARNWYTWLEDYAISQQRNFNIDSTVFEEDLYIKFANSDYIQGPQTEAEGIYCYAQAHSAINGDPLDPIMYCDETGFSIRLHTTRDNTMRILCSDAAKIAGNLAKLLPIDPGALIPDSKPALPLQTQDAVPTHPGREWETIGHSLWSEDPSWFVYIGKEAPGGCLLPDPKVMWPAINPK
ncbi:hypothetical protein TWF696_001163 [Orbilia brochopaga]|uniref:Uncharacterized protein n=1 Tax=Orbilia brochopaga TaxID=3140254 RepID=A0AAV9VG83_9PEZI